MRKIENIYTIHMKDTKLPAAKIDEKSNEITNISQQDTILTISRDAKLRSENNKVVKEKGEVGRREEYEQFSNERLQYEYEHRWSDHLYYMRIDEPETYQRVEELCREAFKSGKLDVELWSERAGIELDWMERRYLDSAGEYRSVLSRKANTLYALHLKYSDALHDTSFNVYDEEHPNSKSNIWNYNTKFNVLIPVDMLNTMGLLNQMKEEDTDKTETKEDNDYKKVEFVYQKIDEAVSTMKQMEKDYSGDLEVLRFGATLDKQGNILYHANYYGCEDEQGISSYNPKELLEKLMNK